MSVTDKPIYFSKVFYSGPDCSDSELDPIIGNQLVTMFIRLYSVKYISQPFLFINKFFEYKAKKALRCCHSVVRRKPR